MKGNKEALEEHDALNKTQKGLASLLWFVENQSKKFFNSTATFGSKHAWIKGDTFKAEKRMLDQFGHDELQLHIQSGRVQWRADPYTPDVYQYKDLGDITGSTEVTRKTQHSMGVEGAATADHEDHFMNGEKDGTTCCMMLRHLAKGKEPLVAKEAEEAKEAKEIKPSWLSPNEM